MSLATFVRFYFDLGALAFEVRDAGGTMKREDYVDGTMTMLLVEDASGHRSAHIAFSNRAYTDDDPGTVMVVLGPTRARQVCLGSDADVSRAIEDIRSYLLGGGIRGEPTIKH